MHSTYSSLEAIEAEIARQDQEWSEVQQHLLALGDVELLVDENALDELTDLTLDRPDHAHVPTAYTRA